MLKIANIVHRKNVADVLIYINIPIKKDKHKHENIFGLKCFNNLNLKKDIWYHLPSYKTAVCGNCLKEVYIIYL